MPGRTILWAAQGDFRHLRRHSDTSLRLLFETTSYSDCDQHEYCACYDHSYCDEDFLHPRKNSDHHYP